MFFVQQSEVEVLVESQQDVLLIDHLNTLQVVNPVQTDLTVSEQTILILKINYTSVELFPEKPNPNYVVFYYFGFLI